MWRSGFALLRGVDVILPRIAVVGVIRGGTSMTVGLLRILGWRLPPDHLPSCPPGEARALRIHNNGRTLTADQVADQVNQLGDGIVWKDPAVALYADRIDWTRWAIVRVRRGHRDVADSMGRWAEHDPEPRDVLARRAIDWNQRLDRQLPPPNDRARNGRRTRRPDLDAARFGRQSRRARTQPATPGPG